MSSAVSHARKRMGWMYALLAALMVAVAVPAVASANIYDLYPAAPPDPQTTNYPAQGAIGQTLRFTWCVPLKAAPADVSTDGLLKLEGYYPKAEWVVANFTGNGEPFFTGNAGYAKKYINSGQIQSTGDERQMCWFADMGSHKPGLMDLKFFVNMEKIEPWLGDGWDDYSGTSSTPVNHHNFLGIWQEIYDITLVADNSGKPLNVFGEPVNTAGKSGVPLVAKVRGSFPLGDKGKKGGKSTVILPDDFGWLAQQYAVDGAGIGNLFPGTGGAAAHRWDIHDDQVFNNKKKGAVQHPYCQTNFPYTDSTGYNLYKNPPHGTNKGTALRHPFYCNPNTEKRPTPKLLAWWSEGNRFETSLAPFLTYLYNPFTLANAVPWPANDVDSVTNAADFGVTTSNRFSNIYGVLGPANPMGPYDPFRFYETYLADGKTDAGDATAPAWRIDFNILANGSAKGSKKGVNAIDGAGYLAEVDKNNRYTVDKNGNWQVGFETEELTSPFYSRYVPALGPYQLGVGTTRAKYSSNVAGYLAPGEYHLWDFVGQWAIDQNRGGGVTGCAESFDDATRVLRKKPAGTDLAATHADEHGEAQVQLKPGTGFYFDALGVKPNSQYGCDLQGIDVLGTSTVVATAYYPDQQPIGYKQMSSNPITKTWNNGYNKQDLLRAQGWQQPRLARGGLGDRHHWQR